MSISAMARATVAATTAAGVPAEVPVAAAPKAPGDELRKLAQWIPSEALATYIAVLGLWLPATSTQRWLLFVLGVALVLLYSVLTLAKESKRSKAAWANDEATKNLPFPSNSGKAVLMVVFAVIAFVVYVGSLPDSPFTAINENAGRFFAIVAVVLIPALPQVADAAGLKLPPTQA